MNAVTTLLAVTAGTHIGGIAGALIAVPACAVTYHTRYMSAGRVAVVTTGSAGGGRAVIRELATHGWEVGVLALGRTTVHRQLTDADGPRFRPHVDEPKDATTDCGAHGMFDATAHARDPWAWASMHRAALGSTVGVATPGGVGAAIRGRHR